MPFRVRGHVLDNLKLAVTKAKELVSKDGGTSLKGDAVRAASAPLYDEAKKEFIALVTVDAEGLRLQKLKSWPKGEEVE